MADTKSAPNAVDILVAIDVSYARDLAPGGVYPAVYLMDTARGSRSSTSGEEGEGGYERVTPVHNGEIVRWTISAIDPDTSVEITGFEGEAFDNHYLPAPQQSPGNPSYWSSRVDNMAAGQKIWYKMSFKLNNGITVTYDPFLQNA